MSQLQDDKKRLKAVIKMYFVVGPTSIMEVVGWYLAYHTTMGRCHAKELAIFFDIINSLQVRYDKLVH